MEEHHFNRFALTFENNSVSPTFSGLLNSNQNCATFHLKICPFNRKQEIVRLCCAMFETFVV